MESNDKNGESDDNKLTNGIEMDDPVNTDKEDISIAPAKNNSEMNERGKVLHSPSPDGSNNSIQPQPANSTFTITVEDNCIEMNDPAINHVVNINTPSSYSKNNSGNSSVNVSDKTVNVPTLQKTSKLQPHNTKNTTNEVRWNLIVKS